MFQKKQLVHFRLLSLIENEVSASASNQQIHHLGMAVFHFPPFLIISANVKKKMYKNFGASRQLRSDFIILVILVTRQ